MKREREREREREDRIGTSRLDALILFSKIGRERERGFVLVKLVHLINR